MLSVAVHDLMPVAGALQYVMYVQSDSSVQHRTGEKSDVYDCLVF